MSKKVLFIIACVTLFVTGTAGLLGECEGDCDRDADCKTGLECADAHTGELIKAGLDKRRAYCPPGKLKWNEEVCYDPKNIAVKKLGLCQVDCDKDSDCDVGLVCAQTQKPYLKQKGWDLRKANCGKKGKWNEEVCFKKD